jgi:hypothetical protein
MTPILERQDFNNFLPAMALVNAEQSGSHWGFRIV